MTTTTPPLVTTTTYSGFSDRTIAASFGVVAAEAVVALQSSGELEGGAEDALRKLRDRAAELGADAIVELKINYKPISGVEGSMMVMVSGTAVKLGGGKTGGINVISIVHT